MDYLLTCKCGREHTISRSQAGQEIQCECGNPLRAPTLRGLSELPQVPMEDITPTVAAARRNWQGWRGPALACTTAVAIIAAGFASWFLLQRAMIDTSYTAEEEIERSKLIFDEYSPEELSLVWNNYEELGMGQKQRPNFYLWNSYATARSYLALINGSVAAFFVLISVAIWYTARKE